MNLADTKFSQISRKFIPGIALGFVVLVLLLLFGDIKAVSQSMLNFNWKVYPLVLLLTLFNYTLRFVKWHFYLGQVGIKDISWKESLKLFVGGFPLAMTPGKAGEVFKGVWLKQRSGLPVARGLSVVVAERISDGLAVLVLSCLGVVAYPAYWPAFAFALVFTLAVIVVSQVRPLALSLLNLAGKVPLVKRIVPGLREFYEGSFSVFRPRATLLAVALGTISWLGEGIGFYLILCGLGLPTGTSLLGSAVFILAFSTVIGALSTLPGGLGAAELSIAGMLVYILHTDAASTSAATLLIRLATLWFGISLGLLVWLLAPDLLGFKRWKGEHAAR